ncbi:MAG: hydroxyacid dehydrogenase [Chloroflexi bacterium]|nr:MAG: hydroxyacid dehydrogenase [Chloroflexota bacterium]
MSQTQPSIGVIIRPSLYSELFTPASDARLRALGNVHFHQQEQNLSGAELAHQLPAYDILITGWGSPRFTDEVLAAAGRLKLIAHTAGSIKAMLPPALFERGIAVTHAASAIAPAVAEMTLLLILLSLRQAHKLDRQLKAGGAWETSKTLGMGRELAGSRVGVVGAGYTGRCVIKLLAALDAEVWVYDPYLSAERAAELGVRPVALDELLANCPIVTLQAPPTQETYRMIGARELRLLQDGAIFINTARSHLVDQEALLAELRTGRIQAALDVFDQEPLPQEHPLRSLDNVILTPHVAGASRQARLRQGQTVVEEIERFLAGQPLRYRVTSDMLDTMA